MIEFRCSYCGRLVRAEESAAYQRVRCPACGRSVPARGQKPGDPRHTGRPLRNDTPDDAKDWAGKSNEEIAEQLLARPHTSDDPNAWALKMLLSPLLPRCDDLTLFTVSLAFLLLVLTNGAMRRDLPAVFHTLGGYGAPVLSLFLVFGMTCSLVSVFLPRKKPRFVKWAMLVFATYVTAGTGIYAGWLMLGRSPVWLMVFPAWNILNGLVLLVLFRVRAIDTEYIVDEKATLGQMVIASLAVFILLTTCRYLFELHWATTCSIAVAYTMNLHNVLLSHSGFRGNRRETQTDGKVDGGIPGHHTDFQGLR
jgi:DNA-directed RNA polymerase subunit RPC12/RpoP